MTSSPLPPSSAGPLQLRRATARDADDVCALLIASRAEAMPWLRVVHTDDETRYWLAHIILPGESWVAELGGIIIGFMALEGEMLEQLYVRPGYQGQGVGDRLLALAKRSRPDGLKLFTFQRNTRARAFYERRGFTVERLNDGSENEECEPDVLYAWQPERS